MQTSLSDRLRAYPGAAHLSALFGRLDPATTGRLMATARLERFDPGTVLIREGEKASRIGFVLSGALGMSRSGHGEERQIVGLILPGDMFGRLFDGPLGHRIAALSAVDVLYFDRQAFEQMLLDVPQAERLFLVEVQDELNSAREWLLLLRGTKVVERVAGFLALMAHRYAPPGRTDSPVTIEMPMSRADMARCLGIRSESLSRALHELRRQDLIELEAPNRFRVPRLSALMEVLGQDSPQHGPDRDPHTTHRG